MQLTAAADWIEIGAGVAVLVDDTPEGICLGVFVDGEITWTQLTRLEALEVSKQITRRIEAQLFKAP